MKKSIILAITFLCVFAQTSFSQRPYRSFRECSNDTIKYLKYNFLERGDNSLYKGKTFAQLMSDVEIKPISLWISGSYDPRTDISLVTGIGLYFTSSTGNKARSHPLKDQYIRIYWETPILQRSIETKTKARLSPPVKGQKKYESASEFFSVYTLGLWIPEFYEYFKDQKIKAIYYCPARY